MICTKCQKDDELDQDLSGLPVRTIVNLCSEWLCDECMDEHEAMNSTTDGAAS